jgi:hypothetical protein
MSVVETLSVEDIKARNKELIEEVLRVYPEKTAKRRAKHLNVHQDGKSDCGVKSNIKSILCLCRLERGGVGADQGHDSYQPRPRGLRPI